MSTDQDYFHRIGNIEAGEKGLRDLKDHTKDKLEIIHNKKEEERDDIARSAEKITSDMKQKLQEQMFKVGDSHFTEEELNSAIENIKNDRDGFQERQGLSDEKTDRAMEHIIAMDAMSAAEKAAYLKQLKLTDPEIHDAIVDDIEMQAGHKNKLEKNYSAEQETVHEDFLDISDDIVSTSTFKVDPVTPTFGPEVAGIGPNAQTLIPHDQSFNVMPTSEDISISSELSNSEPSHVHENNLPTLDA